MQTNHRPLSIHEAAERLGLHYFTVYRMIHSGEIRAAKIGRQWRIRPEEIKRLLEPLPFAERPAE